jgi:hypothetical protein
MFSEAHPLGGLGAPRGLGGLGGETRHLSQTMLLLISIFIIEHNNQIKCIRARHVVGLPGHEGSPV